MPADQDFIPLRSRTTEPAKSYPFVLDAFQKEAINCIDNSESVLVSAHTSAGKTVVALYGLVLFYFFYLTEHKSNLQVCYCYGLEGEATRDIYFTNQSIVKSEV